MSLRKDTGMAARWLVMGLSALALIALLASNTSAAVNTFTTVADTYVNVAYPTSNFGSKIDVKVDDNPKIGYLKFNVSGTSGTITSAKLKLFAETASSAVTVRSVANTSWSETGITYNTRPAVGALLATSGSIAANTWITLDVTDAVVGNGLVSFAVQRAGTGADTEFAAREAGTGANAAKLEITTGTTATATATRTPTPGAGATATRTPTPASGRPFIPYTAGAFFRDALPSSGVPLDSASAAGISFIKSHPEQTLAYPVIRGLAGNLWGTVYFEGDCSDPIWTLTGVVPAESAFLKTEGFHAPAELGSTFTGTNDSPFVVMDRCGVPSMPNGLSVWAANAAKGTGNTISVSAAGAFQHDSNGLDQRNPLSTSNKNFRSRGAIPDAMVIRKDMVTWAINNNADLGYVLHMFWVETDTEMGFVHPMVGLEHEKFGWGAEGMRIRIKESVNVEAKVSTACGKVVARTLKRYGAYLGDNSGSQTALKAEQDHGQWGGLCTENALQGLTWDDFEFVQRGWES